MPNKTLAALVEEGRAAAVILEAVPADLEAGYSDDEVAQQYAATDRLLTAFRGIDEHLTATRALPQVGA